MLRQQPTIPIEPEQITLELLQSYYNVPLAELAKELGLSLTLLKKICRKFGIQRWPHRQIRSINKNIQDLKERLSSVSSAEELTDLKNQIGLLEKKRRLVTKGASSGLHTAVRNAIFLANPEHLEEDSMFDGLNNFGQFHAPIHRPDVKNHHSLDKLKMRMYPNRSQMMMGKDMFSSNHMEIPTHPTNNMFSMINNHPMRQQAFHTQMHQDAMSGMSQAQMMQIIMQQQMQMNNFMSQQPIPSNFEQTPTANEAIPFLEIAAMLETSEDEADNDCSMFDINQPVDSRFGTMLSNFGQQQVLPSSMNTGNNMFSQESTSHYLYNSNQFDVMSMGNFQSM